MNLDADTKQDISQSVLMIDKIVRDEEVFFPPKYVTSSTLESPSLVLNVRKVQKCVGNILIRIK